MSRGSSPACAACPAHGSSQREHRLALLRALGWRLGRACRTGDVPCRRYHLTRGRVSGSLKSRWEIVVCPQCCSVLPKPFALSLSKGRLRRRSRFDKLSTNGLSEQHWVCPQCRAMSSRLKAISG